MATDSVEGKTVLEVKVTRPNGEKWHHASLYVTQFEATATFRAIIKKIKKGLPGHKPVAGSTGRSRHARPSPEGDEPPSSGCPFGFLALPAKH